MVTQAASERQQQQNLQLHAGWEGFEFSWGCIGSCLDDAPSEGSTLGGVLSRHPIKRWWHTSGGHQEALMLKFVRGIGSC